MSSLSLILDEEMNRLITLCSYISQVASRIRLQHLPNVSFSPDSIKFYQQQLLSMSENVEGSAVLLESLLAIEHRKPPRKSRYVYTREELLKLRQSVSPNLSNQMKNSLNEVIERESYYSIHSGKQSWRNIRAILIE